MPLTEQQIRQIVQEEMRKGAISGRFNVQNIPHHTHNGIDSVPVASPTIVYAGFVPYDVTTTILEQFLPSGWSLSRAGAGQYTIVHNLGTTLYSLVATATQSTNEKVLAVVSPFPNEVDVFWFDGGSGAAQNTSFNFVLTQINNKTSTPPKYVSQNVTI